MSLRPRTARPALLLAMTGVLLTGAGAVAFSAATSLDSTEGAASAKAFTLGSFEQQRGRVQAAIESSVNGSGPGYFASDNVTVVKNIREAADGVGGRVNVPRQGA